MPSRRLEAALITALVALASCAARPARGAPVAATAGIDPVLAEVTPVYQDIHAHPELSGHETRTSALLAAKMRALGYDVTEGVGGTGVVAVRKNGPGRTLMIRTELDALPVQERTGLPFASTVRAKDSAGNDVPVAHACGHDLHMATWLATATLAAKDPRAFEEAVLHHAPGARQWSSRRRWAPRTWASTSTPAFPACI
jgi:hippurate hydrolase